MYEVAIRLFEHRSHGNILTRYFETRAEADAVARTVVDVGLAPDATVCQRGTHADAVLWECDEDGIARPHPRTITVVYP